MQVLKSVIMFCLLTQSIMSLAESADLTGTWESTYQGGKMTVIAQQIGTDIVGSFADDQSGVKSSGIVFGRSEADSVMIYYLAAKADGTTVITFADGRLIDQNTIEGNFYYQDSNMISVGGTPYKAIRIK